MLYSVNEKHGFRQITVIVTVIVLSHTMVHCKNVSIICEYRSFVNNIPFRVKVTHFKSNPPNVDEIQST